MFIKSKKRNENAIFGHKYSISFYLHLDVNKSAKVLTAPFFSRGLHSIDNLGTDSARYIKKNMCQRSSYERINTQVYY